MTRFLSVHFCSIAIFCINLAFTNSTNADSPAFSLSKVDNRVIVKIGEKVFAEYVFDDPATNKTYLWPVYGPTGKEMTRSFPMRDIEGEVKDHYHHRGIWFGHEDIGSYDSWAERKTFEKNGVVSKNSEERVSKLGQQKLKRFSSMSTTEKSATLVCEIDYLGADGKKNLSEIRTMVFSADEDTRMIDINQEFIATEGEITFGDKKDAGLSIRVPSTMSVDSKKGGKLFNDSGVEDKAAWGTRGKWCDYIGPVDEETLGVAIFNHPSSFRYPTTWHIRTYGLFTANPFGTLDPQSPNGPHTLKSGEKMMMKHRFVLHDGKFDSKKLSEAYQRYANEK